MGLIPNREPKARKYAREALEARAKRLRENEREMLAIEEGRRQAERKFDEEQRKRIKASEKILKGFR